MTGAMTPCFYLLSLYLTYCISAGYALRCHLCESFGSTDNCTDAPLVKCGRHEDACVIHTQWTGSLYNDMTITKSCHSSDDCRPDESPEPTCYHLDNGGWACDSCCHDDGCNKGANGLAPRPPPYPPVPQPLVERLTATCDRSNVDCQPQGQRLLYDEESGTVLINELCPTPEGVEEETTIQIYSKQQPTYYKPLQHCNTPVDEGFCVKCCGNCTNNAVRLTMANDLRHIVSVLVLLSYHALVRWLVT